jgi:hypothetical protein
MQLLLTGPPGNLNIELALVDEANPMRRDLGHEAVLMVRDSQHMSVARLYLTHAEVIRLANEASAADAMIAERKGMAP